jgi:hypothetical protein
MAELASYIIANPQTVIPSAVAVVRGARYLLASTGLVAITDNSIRGDYVALTAAAASEPFQAASMSEPGHVPALASEATVVGDLAYSAASGKFSKTSANAVLVGRWKQAASGDGVLGVVELFTAA